MSTVDEKGSGGKLRKRRQQRMTPYNRPQTAIRPISNYNWLTRHVVAPASKLVSYFANRFFDSRRKVNRADVASGFQDEVSNELIINSPDSNVISDFKQLLKENTFTRSEIASLTELLHSKAAEASHYLDGREKKETQSGYNGHARIAGGLAVENRSKRIRFHDTMPASPFNPKVLAMADMGSRPSTVSPLMLSMNAHGSREDTAQLIGEANDRLKGVVENKIGSVPSTIYASVPMKSRGVASSILQHLEVMTPREKSLNKSRFDSSSRQNESSSAASAPDSTIGSSPAATSQLFFSGNYITSSSAPLSSSPANNMNADIIEEDPVQSPSQPTVSASPPAFVFGQPGQLNPFKFSAQKIVCSQGNTGSFSLGTDGGDISGRRIVIPSKIRNRSLRM